MFTSDSLQLDSTELQLLLSCVPGAWSDLQCESAHELAGNISCWDSFLKLISRHRMIPQTYWALQQFPAAIPASALRQLSLLNQQCVLNGMLLQAELARISQAFSAEGTQVACLKGPVVEKQVYTAGQRRQYRDLDLLIHPAQLSESCALLRKLGYSGQIAEVAGSSSAKTSRLIRYYRHIHGQRTVGNASLIVELHWRPGGTPRAFSDCHEQIRRHPAAVRIGSTDVATLPERDLLIFLACHGGRHRWKRLSWLCDFARAVEQTPADRWDEIFERAASTSLMPYLSLGFCLLEQLVPHCELPIAARQHAQGARGLSRAIDSCRHAIIADEMYYENQSLSSLSWYFTLPHCFSDRMHALTSVMAPADDDIIRYGWWRGNLRRLGHVISRSLRSPSDRVDDQLRVQSDTHDRMSSESSVRKAA